MKMLLNIDWLEVFGIEPKSGVTLNADYYRAAGYEVKEREYGTRIYKEMFTLKLGGIWCIEVRRNPYGIENNSSVMKHGSTHLRLTNQACYLRNGVDLIREFMEHHGITYKGITRVDICADFTRFENNKKPLNVIKKILERKIIRLNKGLFSIHGREGWNGQNVQTLKWGSERSMITTKLYNKTQEMTDVKAKPYIQQQWRKAGIISDNSTDDVWRLEFSIKSNCKKWIRCENESKEDARLEYIKQDFNIYSNKDYIHELFDSLVKHYFRFKVAKYNSDGELERKTRCKDYELIAQEYEILKPKSDVECAQPTRTEKVLLNYLDKIQDDIRGFWEPEWTRCIVTFRDIIARQKITKDIDHRSKVVDDYWREYTSAAYSNLYETIEHRSIEMPTPLESEW